MIIFFFCTILFDFYYTRPKRQIYSYIEDDTRAWALSVYEFWKKKMARKFVFNHRHVFAGAKIFTVVCVCARVGMCLLWWNWSGKFKFICDAGSSHSDNYFSKFGDLVFPFCSHIYFERVSLPTFVSIDFMLSVSHNTDQPYDGYCKYTPPLSICCEVLCVWDFLSHVGCSEIIVNN